MAEEIIIDSKAQYPSACNSMETLLIDKDISKTFLPRILEKLKQSGVKIILKPKTWSHEYGDLTCAVKVVKDTADAIEHINTFSSHHTDTIVTKVAGIAEEFVKNVDSASVLVNASTRFADGFRYGMGAEVGVSTNRTHARGPVGIEGLLTYKYIVRGEGHLVATYSGDHPKPYLHQKLK